jgi:hypothetical protein
MDKLATFVLFRQPRSVKKRIEEWKNLISQKNSKDKMGHVNWIIGLL